MSNVKFAPKIKLAVTVDDLFLWKGVPWAPGYSPSMVVPAMTRAFAHHGLKGVYAFSATAPAGDDRTMRKIFDHWAEAGRQRIPLRFATLTSRGYAPTAQPHLRRQLS